jgi:hypothetical protein
MCTRKRSASTVYLIVEDMGRWNLIVVKGKVKTQRVDHDQVSPVVQGWHPTRVGISARCTKRYTGDIFNAGHTKTDKETRGNRFCCCHGPQHFVPGHSDRDRRSRTLTLVWQLILGQEKSRCKQEYREKLNAQEDDHPYHGHFGGLVAVHST